MAGLPPTSEFGAGRSEHLDEELLSAYINGEIEDPVELRRVREHLHGCEECRQLLVELSAVVAMLGELEAPRPARSFRLDPSMVPERPSAPLRLLAPDPWYIRFQPAMRRLTAVAALLLVMVVAADLVSSSLTSSEGDESAVQTSAPATQSSSGGQAAPMAGTAATTTTGGATGGATSGSGSSGGAVAPAAGMAESAAASPAADARSAAAGVPASPTTTAANSSKETTSGAAAATAVPQTTPLGAAVPTAAASATPTAVPGGQPVADQAGGTRQQAASQEGSPSIWRLAELALVIVILWLLVLTVAVPRLRSARTGSRSSPR